MLKYEARLQNGKTIKVYSTPNKVAKTLLKIRVKMDLLRIKENLISELNDLNILTDKVNDNDKKELLSFLDKQSTRVVNLLDCDL